jgi:hypothetical protein
MNRSAWTKFVKARDHYRAELEELRRGLPGLRRAQQELVDRKARSGGGGTYTVETAVVFNGALDDVNSGDDIRLIMVADNPGRREQAAENRRYLVGPSGKIAERFFRENPTLGIDFRGNTIILNKTPIHTPRTADLRDLCRAAGLDGALAESQRTMARLLLEFHQALASGAGGPPVWIIGYSEMKRGGIFEAYTETLKELYRPEPSRRPGGAALGERLLVYRHFSMNQFTIDLRQQAAPGESPSASLERIGTAYRRRILGW